MHESFCFRGPLEYNALMFKEVHNNLQDWYAQYGRHHLPWRKTDDAYAIYISEIMLQQTQVSTVLERFYFPFLEAFPTVEDLANANLDDVLKKWEGLGYYRRARNMHEAVQKVSPEMPKTVEGLMQMKGVGQSTAHAVASFAYKTEVPILDANVKRILYRVFARTKASDKELWEMAYKFFDRRHPYEFNQALMDIGSTICTKKPQCNICPLDHSCLASDLNPLDYPAKKIKKIVPVREKSMMIYQQGKKIALEKREGEFLHGLWGLPQLELHEAEGGLLGEIVHKYTHFHLHAKVYTKEKKLQNMDYFTFKEIESLALSTADYKALELYKAC